MKYTRTHDRMGLTAIAAVLALSSTPLAAQEATSPGTTTETPAPAPAEPAVDPLAPAPTPEVSAPADTTMTTEATEATDAAPAAKPATKSVAKKSVKKATSTAPKPATTAKSAAPAATAPAPLAEATPAPAPVPMAAEPAPAEATTAPAQTAEKPKIDEALPVAGGAGAVILALAGAGMAVRRRRRREEDELALDRQAYAESTEAAAWETNAAEEPAPEWSEPVIEAKPVVAPAAMQPTEISDDFDTSGFGRHVKAAYEGPTPENPSLSLRKRLKIAGELDRREKASGITPKPVEAVAKPVSIPAPVLNEKSAMSFGGTAKQVKWPEYQL